MYYLSILAYCGLSLSSGVLIKDDLEVLFFASGWDWIGFPMHKTLEAMIGVDTSPKEIQFHSKLF